MKLKISQIVEGYQVLSRIGSKNMPAKVAYIIQRNMRLLTPDFQDWDKKRTELITNTYGIKDDKNNYTVPPEKIQDFTDEMNAMGSVEVDLDIRVLPLDEFRSEISPIEMMAVEFMFVE